MFCTDVIYFSAYLAVFAYNLKNIFGIMLVFFIPLFHYLFNEFLNRHRIVRKCIISFLIRRIIDLKPVCTVSGLDLYAIFIDVIPFNSVFPIFIFFYRICIVIFIKLNFCIYFHKAEAECAFLKFYFRIISITINTVIIYCYFTYNFKASGSMISFVQVKIITGQNGVFFYV